MFLRMPSLAWPALIAGAGALACTTATAQSGSAGLETSWRVGASSRWLVRGIPLSREGTAVSFAGADLYAQGWSLGALYGRLETQAHESAGAVGLRAAKEWTLDGRWAVTAQLRHNSYPGAPSLQRWCYNEAGVSLADADRWVLSWSAETRRGPGCNQHQGPAVTSRSLELNASWPLAGGWHLGGGAGWRLYGGGDGYLFGQAGAGWQQDHLALQLDRVMVDPAARPLYGAPANNSWVASLVWSF